MNTAVHRFPLAGRPSPTPAPAPVFATFDANRTAELLSSARNSVSTADMLLTFVHGNRNAARQAGIETIIIEISAIMQGESFSGVIDAIEEAGRSGQPLNLSHGGLETLRRIEALIAEASMNMRKFTDGDFTVMELSADRARTEADAQKAYIQMEERRLELMRRELAMKEGVARSQQEAVASLKSSLGYPPAASVNLAQADQQRSSDLSILIPFAILTAVVATVAVVLVATKEK